MQDDALTQKLYENYQRSGREVGYWAAYFLRALKEHGGLKLTKRILGKTTKAGETKGFLALADAGRPDLSVEAVALSPQFRSLFTEQELAVAEQRLRRFPPSSWRKAVNHTSVYPDELPDDADYSEGAIHRVQVNRYERDPKARAACLARHGTRCKVCGLSFKERYGEIGTGFIHIHHVKPLGTMRREYRLKPETDLVPVCPNCHAMLHSSVPPLSVDELRKFLVP